MQKRWQSCLSAFLSWSSSHSAFTATLPNAPISASKLSQQKIALNVLRKVAGKESLRSKRLKAARDKKFPVEILKI
jgi:hypothetical protein